MDNLTDSNTCILTVSLIEIAHNWNDSLAFSCSQHKLPFHQHILRSLYEIFYSQI